MSCLSIVTGSLFILHRFIALVPVLTFTFLLFSEDMAPQSF